jgi:hypothetical protein
MWSIAGALAVISVLVSPVGQRLIKSTTLTPSPIADIIENNMIT